jgi:hypothetical protein
VHPLREALGDPWSFWIGSGPELLQHSPLNALYLPVEVRRTRWDRTKPDRLGHQPTLYGFGKELGAAIGLHTLDRERHLVERLVQKDQRRRPRSTSSQAGHQVTAAVVNGGELVKPWLDFTAVHLYPITRDRSAVTPGLVAASLATGQHVESVPDKDFMNCRRRQLQAMQTMQLMA